MDLNDLPTPQYMIDTGHSSDRLSIYCFEKETLAISKRWLIRIDDSVSSICYNHDYFTVCYKDKEVLSFSFPSEHMNTLSDTFSRCLLFYSSKNSKLLEMESIKSS